MAYLCVDSNGSEWIWAWEPMRLTKQWLTNGPSVLMPMGSIKKLIGRELTWSDEPYELK